jgi:hypothetical protein
MRRAVRSLISLVASGLVLFGVMEIGFQYVNHRMRKAEVSLWHCLAGGILFVLGLILFALSSRLAKRLTEDFEE